MYSYALNATITINVREVLLSLLIIAAIVLVVVLIMLLLRVFGTLKRINSIVDDVSFPLKDTTKELPAIAVNVRDILGNVVDLTDDLTVVSPELFQAILEALQAANAGVGAVSNIVVGFTDGVANFASGFRAGRGRAKPGAAGAAGAGFASTFASMAGSYAGAKSRAQDKKKAGARKRKVRR